MPRFRRLCFFQTEANSRVGKEALFHIRLFRLRIIALSARLTACRKPFSAQDFRRSELQTGAPFRPVGYGGFCPCRHALNARIGSSIRASVIEKRSFHAAFVSAVCKRGARASANAAFAFVPYCVCITPSRSRTCAFSSAHRANHFRASPNEPLPAASALINTPRASNGERGERITGSRR